MTIAAEVCCASLEIEVENFASYGFCVHTCAFNQIMCMYIITIIKLVALLRLSLLPQAW